MKKLYKEVKYFTSKILCDSNVFNYLNKLKAEIKEVEEDTKQIEEYADCLIALFGASNSAGITYDELKNIALNKMVINKNRTWEKQPDGTFQHIKNETKT